MAPIPAAKSEKVPTMHPGPNLRDGFDVTCVIGHVAFGGTDFETTPYEAAFKLIARHGVAGEYSFPHVDGGTVFVTVERQDTAEKEII